MLLADVCVCSDSFFKMMEISVNSFPQNFPTSNADFHYIFLNKKKTMLELSYPHLHVNCMPLICNNTVLKAELCVF